MAQHQVSVTIPQSTSTISVQAISPNRVLGVPPGLFLHPDIQGTAYSDTPCLCFLIEQNDGSSSPRRLLFDLGIRKDWQNSVPSVADAITNMNIQIETYNDTATLLTNEGISLSSITEIVLSHWHFDHVGDPSLFPSTTSLVVGPGFKSAFTPGYPINPDSPILESALAGRDIIEVDFAAYPPLIIGGFQAIDYLSDGSLYLLSTPGHATGHISALARVRIDVDGQSSFVLLAGDLCHHPGELRPSVHVPLPDKSESTAGICPSLYQAVHPSRDTQTPFYVPAQGPFNADPCQMKQTINIAAAFDSDPNIMVLLAHDNSLLSTIPMLPGELNDWKQQGWKDASRWQFLHDFELGRPWD